jgi:hypothetical protein
MRFLAWSAVHPNTAIIEVKDSFNKTIYLDLTSIQANNEHVFTLENISSGEYIIEIKSGENYIIGCFIL